MSRCAALRALALALTLCVAVPAFAAPRFRPVSDDVFYMFMPIAWRDSDGDPVRYGDFGGMTASVPYLKSIGATAVWMTPIFPSAAYHGYQHGAADSLNARFGSEAQFWDFVQAAHAESIKVFIDFVAYGISQNSPWFQSAYGHPESPYDGELAFTNAGNTEYLGCCPYPTWDGSTVGFVFWDLRNPVVRLRVTQWGLYWLDPNGDGNPEDGIDGYRLDHVSFHDPAEMAFGYDLDFWQDWASALRSVNPDVFLFAEQANWGSFGAELFPAFDAAFTKPFEFAARAGIAGADARPFAGAMSSTMSLLRTNRLFLTTIGNHDVNRLATELGDDPGKLRAAAAVLMLQPLPPVLYFGDELGMRGAKRFDYVGDAVDIPFREPFKWNAVAGPPMTNYFGLNGPAYAQRVEQDHDGRSVEEQSGVPGSLLETYRALAALRHARPGLRRGTYLPVASADSSVWAFARIAAEETLLVLVHVGPGELAATEVDLSALGTPTANSPVEDAPTGASLAALTPANRGAYPVALGAWGWRVLRLHAGPRDIRPHWADANRVLTQTTPAPYLDNSYELDQLFTRFDPDGLALGLTGNLIGGGNSLVLLFDAVAGGQTTLETSTFGMPPSTMPYLSGLAMDAGFEPEVALAINTYQGTVYSDLYMLASAGGGTHRYLGAVPVGANTALTGGTNPNGARVSYSGTNVLGVTLETATSAATATDGWELLLPWADLGMAGPGTPLKMCAFLAGFDGWVLNQFMPPLGPAATSPGYAPLSLASVPGDQFVTFDATTAVEVSLMSATIDAHGVVVIWQVGSFEGASLAVERRVEGDAWLRMGAVSPDGLGRVRVEDPPPAPGARVAYRLVSTEGGVTRVLGQTELQAPLSGLTLRVLGANPTFGAIRVRLSLAWRGDARIDLLDVGGRRVWGRRLDLVHAMGATLPAATDLSLAEGVRLPAGLYFVRLSEAGESRLARVIVVR